MQMACNTFFSLLFFSDIYGHYFISFDRSVVASLLFNAKKKKQQKWKKYGAFFLFRLYKKIPKKESTKLFFVNTKNSSIFCIWYREGCERYYVLVIWINGTGELARDTWRFWRHAKWTSPLFPIHSKTNDESQWGEEDKDEYVLH